MARSRKTGRTRTSRRSSKPRTSGISRSRTRRSSSNRSSFSSSSSYRTGSSRTTRREYTGRRFPTPSRSQSTRSRTTKSEPSKHSFIDLAIPVREGGELLASSSYRSAQDSPKRGLQDSLLGESIVTEEKSFNIPPISPKLIGGAVAALIGFALIFMFVSESESKAQITEVAWEYTAEVEQLNTLQDSGWSTPSGARIHDSYLKFSHDEPIYDRQEYWGVVDTYWGPEYVCGSGIDSEGYEYTDYCQDEYEDYGWICCEDVVIGYDPIYEVWYEYEHDVWQLERTLRESGSHFANSNPVCPSSELLELQRLLACQKYHQVQLTEEEGAEAVEITEVQYRSLQEGDTVVIVRNRFGSVQEIIWPPQP